MVLHNCILWKWFRSFLPKVTQKERYFAYPIDRNPRGVTPFSYAYYDSIDTFCVSQSYGSKTFLLEL